ncbi:MAG TPA: RNA-binding S4 domain-containing protein [Castellaniella sp.]|uniref:RNA-binding S4 domain-containing protein n=1 Tax=Castellaniella sp. TaxID=1955812 RepID=UPI002EF0634F
MKSIDRSQGAEGTNVGKLRLDKWLWAARFYKTRGLAVDAIVGGRIKLNDQIVAKPAREVAVGDLVRIRKPNFDAEVEVRALSAVRGPAPQAALLYEETAASVAAREQLAEQRRLAPEPALDYTAGRPTKRDRRLINDLRGR